MTASGIPDGACRFPREVELSKSGFAKMQVSSGQSSPVRVYVGPNPGSPQQNAVAVRVLVAWADFFRIPLQCFVAEPARPPRENYRELLDSDMYVAFAEGDDPAFLAEWHMASGLSIPAFGYVEREAPSPLQPPPRMVHSLPNFSAALGADLVHYSNRGFSRSDHHASLRALVAADPVLLCLVLAGLECRDFRRVCTNLNFKGRGGRLTMCREVMRDPSERHREIVAQCLELEVPAIFGSAADTAGRAFFPCQASAYLFDVPSPRPAEARCAEVTVPLPVSRPPTGGDVEIPGEVGKWTKLWNFFWHRNPIVAVLLLFLVLPGIGVWSFQEALKAWVARKVAERFSEEIAAALYLGVWPQKDTEGTWTVNRGDKWDKVPNIPGRKFPIDENSLWFADLGDKRLGDYFTTFWIFLHHDQQYVAWIPRGKPKGDYYAIEYSFPSTTNKNTGVGLGIIRGCLYHSDKMLGRCESFSGFESAPLRNGDGLRVLMAVRGNRATTVVTLERNPLLFGAPKADASAIEHVYAFSIDVNLADGLFGFRSEPGPARPGFIVRDFSLTAYAKDAMKPQAGEDSNTKAEAPPK